MSFAWELAKRSYWWTLLNIKSLLKLLFPIVILSIIGVLVLSNVYKDSFLLIIPIYILGLWITSTSMIQIHRMIILSLPKNKIRIFPKPEKAHFIYIGIWILLTFIGKISNQIEIDPSELILILVFSIVLSYFLVRAYFIFPAIAVNKFQRNSIAGIFIFSKINSG